MQQETDHRVTRVGKKISPHVVAVVALVFTLVLLELGLRVAHFIHPWREWPGYVTWGSKPSSSLLHQASSIPGLDYEMAPNREMVLGGIPIRTNQFGMRDDEAIDRNAESRCRIAVVGDSYTFGWRVGTDQAYPKVLEKRLRESPAGSQCHFQVLNFGVVGYSSYDEDLMLKYRVLNFQPHVVIIGYVLNDPEVDPVQLLHAYFVSPPWWQNSYVFRLIAQAKARWDVRRLGGGDYYVYLHAQGHRKWQSVIDAFGDIRDVTSRRNIKVVVVIFPMLTQPFTGKPWNYYPYTQLHHQVSDLAVHDGFRVVDLLDAFREHPSQDVVFGGGDDHPTALGHEVAARAIEKELLSESSFYFDLLPQNPANLFL